MRNTISTLYSAADTKVSDYGIDVPDWINQDITAGTLAAILEGGFAFGAGMPAITYWSAVRIMADHGDDVLSFITDHTGELPAISDQESWSGIAVHFLSYAVELWAASVGDEIAEGILESDDE